MCDRRDSHTALRAPKVGGVAPPWKQQSKWDNVTCGCCYTVFRMKVKQLTRKQLCSVDE